MQQETTYPDLHVARASDLEGADRALYRGLEMLPGILSVGTIIGVTVLSFFIPSVVAYFTIAFSAWWMMKCWFLFVHLRHNFKRLKHSLQVDWLERLEHMQYQDLVHVVLFPFYKEGYEVMEASVKALAESHFPTDQIVVVLAAEERAGEEPLATAKRIQAAYADRFKKVLITIHPKDTPGELPGKGSNIAYAAKETTRLFVDVEGIPYEKVIVSAFDIDTVVYPGYFACLTWHFLTCENPMKSSFQPVPLYNNNIETAPMLSRVLAYSSTFWQMILQERPERLSTFSSHAVPLRPLHDAGYWQNNMVSEDSRIYWNLFIFNNGNYEVIPLAYPVSMDANVAPTFRETVVNLYKQHRRWSYGAENIPYLVFHFIKNKRIPLLRKGQILLVQVEGFWSLVTQPLVLFALGWLPLFIGGRAFNSTVLSYNLPIVSSWFLALATFGLVGLAVYSWQLLPKPADRRPLWKKILLILQWALVPYSMVIFSSIPGLEAQVRLMIGKYLGFWITPKHRVPTK